MLTGKDVKILVKEFEKTFATKKDLSDFKKEMGTDFFDFKSQMSIEFLNLESRLDAKLEDYHSEVIGFKDEVMKGLDNINGLILDLKQEKVFTDQGINRLDENDINQQKEIENHSQQIKRIKKHLKIA